jgi:hypothetical protein
LVTLPTKPSSGLAGVTVSSPASSPETPTATGLSPAWLLIVAVDLSDQHHADDLERLGVGDAQPVLELGLLADPAKHRVDLRAAAVDQHAAHADAAQQQHVLGQREVGFAVDRGAAELDHDRLAGELADVGQRLDEDARGFGGGHDVLLFSLM